MAYVFDITKCDLPPVEPVSPDTWLPDTNIPDWPDDIQACVPLPPPQLDVDFPCVTLWAGADGYLRTINGVTVTGGETTPPPPVFVQASQAQLILTIIPESCCTYVIQVDPYWPCPTFPYGRMYFTVDWGNVGGFIDVAPEDCCGFSITGHLWGGLSMNPSIPPVYVEIFELQCCQTPHHQWSMREVPGAGHQWFLEIQVPNCCQVYQELQYQLDHCQCQWCDTPLEDLDVVTGWQVVGTEIQVQTTRIRACVLSQGQWVTVHTGIQCQE